VQHFEFLYNAVFQEDDRSRGGFRSLHREDEPRFLTCSTTNATRKCCKSASGPVMIGIER
jgi:hypothetical protein